MTNANQPADDQQDQENYPPAPVDRQAGLSEAGALYLAESGLVAPGQVPADLSSIPEFSQVLGDLGIPQHVATQYLLDRDVALVTWREQQALLESTGEITDGFLVLAWLPDEKRYVTTFMGAMVLCRALRAISPPVRVRLVKQGRTLVFQ